MGNKIVQIKKRHFIILIVLLVFLSSTATFVFSASIFDSIGFKKTVLNTVYSLFGMDIDEDDIDYFSKVYKTKRYIDKYYLNDVDEEKLTDSVLEKMLDSLNDPYTTYLDKDEYANLLKSTNGFYYGIGVYLEINNNNESVVISIIKGSPADKAGIKVGDKVLKINGNDIRELDIDSITNFIDCDESQVGEELELTISRSVDGTYTELDLYVNIDKIVFETVFGEVLEDNIGYIKITSFGDQTFESFKDIYEELKSKKITGLIIDLRDNSGGLVRSAVNIADILVPEGKIVYTKDKNGKVKDWFSDADCCDVPIVVIMNEKSASASEILAGCLNDYDSVIVGTKSYGKGIVQSVINLGDDTAIKITSSEYYTPLDRRINKVGLEPDYEIFNDGDSDLQLEKAKEILKSK